MLGEAEAAAYSECVQESDAQVPLGFKSVPLAQVFTALGATAATSPAARPGTPATASVAVQFDRPAELGIDAQLKEQECDRVASERGAVLRA